MQDVWLRDLTAETAASSRALFPELTSTFCVALHLSGWGTAVVLGVYAIAEYVDQWRIRTARENVVEDVVYGWKPKNADSEWEDKGNLTRIRLVGQNPIIVARVAELVERMQ